MGIWFGCDFRQFVPINDTELNGHVSHTGLITVKGPCGEGHTMNYDTARKLANWLLSAVGPAPFQLPENYVDASVA